MLQVYVLPPCHWGSGIDFFSRKGPRPTSQTPSGRGNCKTSSTMLDPAHGGSFSRLPRPSPSALSGGRKPLRHHCAPGARQTSSRNGLRFRGGCHGQRNFFRRFHRYSFSLPGRLDPDSLWSRHPTVLVLPRRGALPVQFSSRDSGSGSLASRPWSSRLFLEHVLFLSRCQVSGCRSGQSLPSDMAFLHFQHHPSDPWC